jgi:hypothetical protein
MNSLIIYTLVYVCLIFSAFKLNLAFNYSTLKDYVDVLLSVSGMVFTIMGIWIAFLYPNALNRIKDPQKIETADFSEALVETKRLENIVGSVLMSAFVMLGVMIILLMKLMFNELDIVRSNICILKSIVLSTVAWLTLLQMKAVGNVVYSNIMFLNDLHSKRASREEDQL